MHYNSTPYFYILNLQGDVIRMVDGNGNTVASYEYDPYGRVISATGSMADINPLRYRGYYYDQETKLYHLWSRYYDPQTGRFISADSYTSTGAGIVGNNMFAYCNNNPINYIDKFGTFGLLVAAVIATGAVVGGLLGAFTAATTGGNILESAIEGCLTGAFGATCGLLIANPVAAVGLAVLGGSAIDFATQVTTQLIEDKSVNFSEVDYGRVAKTGIQTGIGTAIPQLGDAAGNAVDAFGTALVWAEGAVLIACADVVVTNAIGVNRWETGSTGVNHSTRMNFNRTMILI